MALSKDSDCSVIFSVTAISLRNEFDISTKNEFGEKYNYFVINKGGGAKRVRVTVSKKSDAVFHLYKGSSECCVAAGMSMPVILEYTPDSSCQHNGELEIYVGEKLNAIIPITAVPPCACLESDTFKVDFGTQVCEHQLISQQFYIKNSGDLEGCFCSQSNPSSYFMISPPKGKIKPYQSQEISLKLRCNFIGEVTEHIRFDVDNRNYNSFIIDVRCTLVKRALEFLDPSDIKLQLDRISFGSMYYGSVASRKVILFNNSPMVSDYISVFDDKLSGYVNVNECLAMAEQYTMNEQGTQFDLDLLVDISPNRGTLKPYEKQMIELKFSPQAPFTEKGWEHCQSPQTQRDYNLFIKFLLVTGSISTGHNYKMLALTASARPVDIKIMPSSTVHFGSCITGDVRKKTIEIRNISDTLPLKFKCQELAHYKCHPSSGVIGEGKSAFIIISFQPKQLGHLIFKLSIYLWGPDSRFLRTESVIHTSLVQLKGCGCTQNLAINRTSDSNKIANVNDLACSIRPCSTDEKRIMTPFTKVPRYSYVDRDYCDLPEKKEMKLCHNSGRMHANNSWKKKEKSISNQAYANEVDLRMGPVSALKQPTFSSKGALQECATSIPVTQKKMITPTDLFESISTELQYSDGCLTEVILDTNVIEECERTVPPDELSQIVVEPSVLSFGKIVVNSIVQKELFIKNFTSRYVSIKLGMSDSQMKCTKYPNKSEILFILHPRSFTNFCFTMMQSTPGNIEGSLKCVINNQHSYFIRVCGSVDELSLKLSSNTVFLHNQSYTSAYSGLWGSVELINDHDIPIAFKWCPKDGIDDNVCFSMHSSGIIPNGTRLICGFICQPSFDSPSSAEFILFIGNIGENIEYKRYSMITCITKGQKIKLCVYPQQRILFGNIPLNLTSSKLVHFRNKSDSRAYFKVSAVKNDLNVNVSPLSGCLLAKETIELRVDLCPTTIGSFDIKVCVYVKESKSVYMRLTGTVEKPRVTIDKDIFNFGGVHCGSKTTQPYVLRNQGSCQVELTFDFSRLRDFTLVVPDSYHSTKFGKGKERTNPIVLKLPGKSSVSCSLEFKPREMAAYDFFLTVLVNGLKPSFPPALPWPPSNTHSSLCAVNELNTTFTNTPTRRVIASVLQSPILLSNFEVSFMLHSTLKSTGKPVISEKVITLANIGTKPLTWSFDLARCKHIIDGTFGFVHPSSGDPLILPQPDNPQCLVPGEEYSMRVSCSLGCLGSLRATIPFLLDENPIPFSELLLNATFLPKTISVNPSPVILHPVPLDISLRTEFIIILNGFERLVEVDVDVTLPKLEDYVHLTVQFPSGSRFSGMKAEIPCILEFCSTRPISKICDLIFMENNSGIRNKVPVSITADNSMFSVYEFVSENLDSTIIKLDHNAVPIFFLEEKRCAKMSLSKYTSRLSIPPNDSKKYFHDCINALCRWMSVYGSPHIKNLNLPTDFCEKVKQDIPTGPKQRSSANISRGMLVDMLTSLCGRIPPGIPHNLPPCATISEKIIQQYSTYDTILTFLKNQGAMLSSVVPETLLDYHDYLLWMTEIKKSQHLKDYKEFSIISSQSWNCVLMQTVKVLVLPWLIKTNDLVQECGISLKTLHSSVSNIYSTLERGLLLWLNYHYKLHKELLCGVKGSEVVNFDTNLMDGTVLACVLYSYCPFLKQSHFEKLFFQPSALEQSVHNAIIIIKALRYIGIKYDVQQTDISSPNPIFMILFCAHLFHVLPSYKPNDTIKFLTPLSTSEEVNIEVFNQGIKKVEYSVLIRGENMKNFASIESISVPGRKKKQLTLCYQCSILRPANATLFLVARSKQYIGSTISYTLLGCTSGAKPQIQKKIETYLYEPAVMDFLVSSPFTNSAEFEVKICESEDTSHLYSRESKSKLNHSPRYLPFIPVAYLQEVTERSKKKMNFFHCDECRISLDPDTATVLTIQFIPLKFNDRHCSIILSNPTQGDIVLSLIAHVKKPLPVLPQTLYRDHHTTINQESKTLHLNSFSGQSLTEEIIIQNSNLAFENALLEISKWKLSEEELKWHSLTKSLKYATLSNCVSKLGLGECVNIHDDGAHKYILFSIEESNDHQFLFPREVRVPTNVKDKGILPLQFHSDKEGQYECHLTLKSGYDVRTFVIEATVFSKKKVVQIEFRTQATQSIVQNIPVVNPSTLDWHLISTISSPQFTGPKKFTANALTTTCYPLRFCSQKEGKVEGELKLTNSADHTEYVFQLTGIADRPFAEDTVKLNCKVNQKMTHIIPVRNYKARTTVYSVESDLDFISGPSEIKIGGDEVYNYPLTIVPKKRGQFSGAVLFIAKHMERVSSKESDLQSIDDETNTNFYHIWFQVECQVNPSSPECSMLISCPVFSTKTMELDIVNPHNEILTLNVKFNGECLSGQDTLILEPLKKSSYDITYSPKLFGKFNGRVIFDGSIGGEFWYKLNLEALDPEEIIMPLVECEVGRNICQVITLNNPLDNFVNFTCNNCNTRNYTVTGLAGGQIEVSPHSEMDVHVLFYPSSIKKESHVDLAFISGEFGKQIFTLRGKGLIPSIMDTATMTANLNSTIVHVINFMNPLELSAHLTVLLSGKDSESFFLLMKQSNNISIQPGESMDIPVVFSPHKMHRHEICIKILASTQDENFGPNYKEDHEPNLCWEYPIHGQPMLKLSTFDNAPKFKCFAKEQLEQIMEITLIESLNSTEQYFKFSDNCSLTNLHDSGTYTSEMKCDDESLVSLFHQAVAVKLLGEVKCYLKKPTNEEILVVKVIFIPSKAFRGVCDLTIRSSKGGVWILPLNFHAIAPSPDDVITIEAVGLNKEARVTFRLSSTTMNSVPFTAHIIRGSDPEITVSPLSGTLSSCDSQGTLFTIKYKPTMYGKKHHAKLIVQCDTAEWCYEIIGKLPAYTAPPHYFPMAVDQCPDLKIKHKIK